MDENNVKLGQIRTEECVDEAKISAPDTFFFARPIDRINVSEVDAIQEGEDLRIIQKSRKRIATYAVRDG